MHEKVAITIDVKKEVFEDLKRFATETGVTWQMAASSLIEGTLKLTRDGQRLAAGDEAKALKKRQGPKVVEIESSRQG